MFWCLTSLLVKLLVFVNISRSIRNRFPSQNKGSIFLVPVSPFVSRGAKIAFVWACDFWPVLNVRYFSVAFPCGFTIFGARQFRRPWVDGDQKNASLMLHHFYSSSIALYQRYWILIVLLVSDLGWVLIFFEENQTSFLITNYVKWTLNANSLLIIK